MIRVVVADDQSLIRAGLRGILEGEPDIAVVAEAADGREAVDAEWIAPAEVLRLADAGERTVIFPTRMNVQLLAEANSAQDCVTRAEKRELVTVLPVVEVRDGARFLVIPSNAGYGDVAESMERVGA